MKVAENTESIIVENLSVGWNGIVVAGKVEFKLSVGEIIVIAGPNGAGKSTIVKTIARQVRQLSGKMAIDGQEIWQYSPQEFAKQVAYVPQTMENNQDLTVFELVSLGRNPHQRWWSWHMSEMDRQAIKHSLERTALWELRNKNLSHLSGGERQRATIATALAQQPRFMLLDEPTTHLDFRHQLELADLLVELKSQGMGILVVLHDLNLMARVADKILLLGKQDSEPSKVICFAPAAQVLTEEIIRKVYRVELSIMVDSESGMTLYAATNCSN